VPHGPNYSHAARKRASAEFSHRLLTVTGSPHEGDLSPRKSFLSVTPENVGLLTFRRKSSGSLELRVVEVAGEKASAQLELAFPIGRAQETDLLGRKVATVSRSGSRLQFPIQPWKLRTFEVG
jgi:alpha-mannosidase